MKVEISQEGLTNALLSAREAEKRKLADKEVLVWAHLVKLAMGRTGSMPTHKVPIEMLFSIMRNDRYTAMFKTGMTRCTTDEVPTQFMRDLYKEFKEWSIKHPRTTRR